MKQIILLIFVVFTLWAEPYPAMYASYGTPLYKVNSIFNKLTDFEDVKAKSIHYHDSCEALMKTGFELESDEPVNKEKRKTYLKSLRALEKEYQFIIYLLNNHLSQAIATENTPQFFKIIDTELKGIAKQAPLVLQTISFYKTQEKKSPYIEMLIKEEALKRENRSVQKRDKRKKLAQRGTKTVAHVIGVYEGDYPNGKRHAFRFHPDGHIDVEVKNNPEVKAYILVLTSYEPVQWRIHNVDHAKIKKIILSAYHPSKVLGANSVPVVRVKLGYAYDDLSKETLKKVKKLVKFDSHSFQGSYKGKLFEVY